ncbi:MAG: threonine synthase, partial [Saprospiraceae bacterium]|nr:threonine synthase [Saprospiraceae bacterium]
VVILFPKGKVSALQQKQLTTHGDNIAAIEIDGTFDDCQALVKQSFSDASITSNIRLSSANSINIARLIPQSFYYFEGYKQLETSDQITFSVPSGNFGNLTAGIIAKKLGLPIKHLVAATNVNDIVPVYLASERFQPRPSRQTLSNAMDVGNPSNFDRMLYFYGSTWNDLRNDIHGHSYSDMQTIQAIKEVYERFEYLLDPHGAVAYLAARDYIRSFSHPVIVLETAHPSKFLDTVQYATRKTFPLHPILQKLTDLQEQFLPMSPNYEELQTYLHERFN